MRPTDRNSATSPASNFHDHEFANMAGLVIKDVPVMNIIASCFAVFAFNSLESFEIWYWNGCNHRCVLAAGQEILIFLIPLKTNEFENTPKILYERGKIKYEVLCELTCIIWLTCTSDCCWLVGNTFVNPAPQPANRLTQIWICMHSSVFGRGHEDSDGLFLTPSHLLSVM